MCVIDLLLINKLNNYYVRINEAIISTYTGLLQCNGQEEATLTEILKHLEKAYCGQLSVEIQHIVV